jgi:hypothetical protein
MWNTHVNEVISNLGKDHIIVHLPKVYMWVGLACATFFAILLVSSQYFFTETRSTFTDLGFSMFTLLGLLIFVPAFVWRIDVYKSRDYFLIRNSFWITKKVEYSDITGFSRNDINLSIITKKRKIKIWGVLRKAKSLCDIS